MLKYTQKQVKHTNTSNYAPPSSPLYSPRKLSLISTSPSGYFAPFTSKFKGTMLLSLGKFIFFLSF